MGQGKHQHAEEAGSEALVQRSIMELRMLGPRLQLPKSLSWLKGALGSAPIFVASSATGGSGPWSHDDLGDFDGLLGFFQRYAGLPFNPFLTLPFHDHLFITSLGAAADPTNNGELRAFSNTFVAKRFDGWNFIDVCIAVDVFSGEYSLLAFDGGEYKHPQEGEGPLAAQLSLGFARALLENRAVVSERRLSPLRTSRLRRGGDPKGFTYKMIDCLKPPIPPLLSEAGQSSHASPRWHIRRGHIRRLRDGREVFIRQSEVGCKDIGQVAHDYML